jgi:hypothetical protein
MPGIDLRKHTGEFLPRKFAVIHKGKIKPLPFKYLSHFF